jgi:hypothetical protein
VITTQLIKGIARIPSKRGLKIYMNRTILQYLELEQRAAVSTGGQLSYDVIDGLPVTSFRGIPIRISDCAGRDRSARHLTALDLARSLSLAQFTLL